MTLRDGYALVYLENGARVSHILPPERTQDRAVCSRVPTWPDVWRGLGDQQEWETARVLPVCVGCAGHIRKYGLEG